MTVIALTSASGAPGVTTAALALTLAWPRQALLAECDAAGGSAVLAGHQRANVRHDRGLVQLAVAHRHDQIADQLWSQTLELAPGRAMLPGLQDATQAPNMSSVWATLARQFRALGDQGVDVIVDAGRAGTEYGPTQVLRQADLTLLVLRATLPSLNAARARMTALRSAVGVDDPVEPRRFGLLLVGADQHFTAARIAKALNTGVVATLALDPVSAEVYSLGAKPGRRHHNAPLATSVAAAIPAILRHAGVTPQQLQQPQPPVAVQPPHAQTVTPTFPQEQSHV